MRVLSSGPDPDLVMTTSGDDRKEGVHLSDITKRMVFEKDKKLNPNNPIDAMVLERGFTWERILELALHSRHKRPGHRPEQIQEDGIWMSPDWISEEPEPLVEEWKCTKKSSKQGFEAVSWHWLPNAKAYLRAAVKRGWVRQLVIRFRLWWMNGDYSFESKNSDWHLLNDYWKVDVEFDKRELEENWRSVLSAGRKYGLLKEPPQELTRGAGTRGQRVGASAGYAPTSPVSEEQWQKKQTPPKKNGGSPPVKSRGKVLTGTFPRTKKS